MLELDPDPGVVIAIIRFPNTKAQEVAVRTRPHRTCPAGDIKCPIDEFGIGFEISIAATVADRDHYCATPFIRVDYPVDGWGVDYIHRSVHTAFYGIAGDLVADT